MNAVQKSLPMLDVYKITQLFCQFVFFSLSWTGAAEESPYDAFLCAGSSEGGLYVWSLKIQHTPSFYT